MRCVLQGQNGGANKSDRCSIFFMVGRAGVLLVAALSIAVAGCGASPDPDRLAVFPASGKISFNGKVPDGAYLALHSKTKAKAPNGQEVVPSAQVKSDGTFQLSSYAANDGAPTGEYAVTIEWHKTIKQAAGDPMLGPNLLPPQYSRSQTSPLTVTIAAGMNELKPIVLK
jgi:hypothetical protein